MKLAGPMSEVFIGPCKKCLFFMYLILFRAGLDRIFSLKNIIPLIRKALKTVSKINNYILNIIYYIIAVQCNLIWINALQCLRMQMKYLCFVALKYSDSRRHHGPNVISTGLRVMSPCSHPGSMVYCSASAMLLPVYPHL